MKTLIGMLAGTLTTMAFLPQVVKIIRTKETHDISLVMYLIFNLGVICWLIYGILLKEFPIIIANSITIIMSLYILILKIKHG